MFLFFTIILIPNASYKQAPMPLTISIYCYKDGNGSKHDHHDFIPLHYTEFVSGTVCNASTMCNPKRVIMTDTSARVMNELWL